MKKFKLVMAILAVLTLTAMAFYMEADSQTVVQYRPVYVNSFEGIERSKIIELVNKEREKEGLAILRTNPTLNQSAQMKANDIVSRKYWAHVAPDGTEPWHWFKVVGYDYRKAGENLSKGYDKADEVVKAWMGSPGHRANIMNPLYNETGIGMAKKQNGTIIVVHHFGGSR